MHTFTCKRRRSRIRARCSWLQCIMTSVHIPPSPGNRLREKRSISISPRLPTVANGLHEKQHWTRSVSSWTTMYYIPLPWPFSRRTGVRYLRICFPIPRRVSQSMRSLGRTRSRWSQILLVLGLLTLCWQLYGFVWLGMSIPVSPFPKKPTLVFSSEDLRRIWEWEVASGHFQSSKKST